MGGIFSNCCSSEIPVSNLEVVIDQQEQQNNKILQRNNNLTEARIYSNTHSRISSFSSNCLDQYIDGNLNDAQRLKRLAECFYESKKLRLRVISSGNMSKGTVFVINSQQMEGGLRNAKDGVTYFGFKKRNVSSNPYFKSQEIINDFLLPAKDKETAQNFRGRHFKIWFDPFEQKYFIRDLGIGFGVYVKLDYVLKLKDNHLLQLGESFAAINLLSNDENSIQTRLRIKLFGGPSNGNVLLYLNDDFEIHSGMIFKGNQTVFQTYLM